MRLQRVLLFLITIMVTLSLSSCHKDYLTTEEANAQASVTKKIDHWLERQESASTGASESPTTVKINGTGAEAKGNSRNANIELLRESLDFSNVEHEIRNGKMRFIVVPIKDDVKSKKHLDNNGSLYLLITTNERDEILGGNIVYYIPADGKQKKLQKNVFADIFNDKKIRDDGTYNIMTITGKWISRMVYKNGKRYAGGDIRPGLGKDANGNLIPIDAKKKTNGLCIDWFLVTTYHYPDGSTEQTTEYVGRTCYGCEDLNYMSLCPGGDGGGGGGPDEEESITTQTISDENYEAPIPMEDEADLLATSPSSDFDYWPDPALKWSHFATVEYTTKLGYSWVSNVTIENARAEPIQYDYETPYGWARRNVTLFGHSNYYTNYTGLIVEITWRCYNTRVWVVPRTNGWSVVRYHWNRKVF